MKEGRRGKQKRKRKRSEMMKGLRLELKEIWRFRRSGIVDVNMKTTICSLKSEQRNGSIRGRRDGGMSWERNP